MLRTLVYETLAGWQRHNVPRLSAALAFYTLLSMAPLLVIVIAIAGMAFGREAAEGQIYWQVKDLVGDQGARAIQMMLTSARNPSDGLLAGLIGVIALLYGATSVVAELRDALNTIWNVKTKEAPTGWMTVVSLVRDRLLSFAMVMAVGFLLIVSLVVNAALAAAGKFYAEWLPASETFLESVHFILSFAVLTVLFAMIYRVLPDLRIPLSDVLAGAIVTSLLFTFGKYCIGLYLGKSSFASAYGAAGSLVIVLVWVYYSAQIFFLGAEFTQVYANRCGSRTVAQPRPLPA